MKSQHCKALTKEQREVLDEAARHYGLDWWVMNGKHAKIYLGGVLVTVISHSRDTNNRSPVAPAMRLKAQIRQAMERGR
jgi:hypothetical protein